MLNVDCSPWWSYQIEFQVTGAAVVVADLWNYFEGPNVADA